MDRRNFIAGSVTLTAFAAIPTLELPAWANAEHRSAGALVTNALTPPPVGKIPVAFLISENVAMIDFAGPWEVFQDTFIRSRPKDDHTPFRLFTVAETMDIVHASGGMKISPDYTFANAPDPKVIVIPAQSGRTPATLDWIRNASKRADLTMSVCTGAFVLAKTGLLSGKSATTHHRSLQAMQRYYPDIQVKPGARFVESGNLASAAGLSSGIDLALRVVERYYGRQAALDTAYEMEYQGQGWMNPSSNSLYAEPLLSTQEHPLCPVCLRQVDPHTSPESTYSGKTYYFCTTSHKQEFDKSPKEYLSDTH